MILEKLVAVITNNYYLICPPILLECSSVDLVVVVKLTLLCICSISFSSMIRFTYMLKISNNLNIENYWIHSAPISEEAGYDVIEDSNDEIIPLEGLDNDNQKIVIFDDFVCEKNQKPLVDYFIGGRHKNCSVIYLSQSYYLTPKDIRLNCSHFCIFDSPSANETARMCKEVNVPKGKFLKATAEPYSFAYIDKINKTMRKNFNENL